MLHFIRICHRHDWRVMLNNKWPPNGGKIHRLRWTPRYPQFITLFLRNENKLCWIKWLKKNQDSFQPCNMVKQAVMNNKKVFYILSPYLIYQKLIEDTVWGLKAPAHLLFQKSPSWPLPKSCAHTCKMPHVWTGSFFVTSPPIHRRTDSSYM